jgi:nicotinate-nucleotide adenylyltransferase
MKNIFSNEQIEALRRRVSSVISPYRLEHTFGVESMAARIGALYCPEKLDVLRVAALLHDVTKELSVEEQCDILRSHGLAPTEEQLASPATLHSRTAALIIPEKYSEFATDDVLSAVRYHTTGRENMTLCEKIIYLADYIDETRKYDDCIALREEFFAPKLDEMSIDGLLKHLNRVILHSLDMTVSDLEEKGRIVSSDSLKARESIIIELENKGVK